MTSTVSPINGFISGLNNIPRNLSNGYGHWSCGKVEMPNGDFLFYGSIGIEEIDIPYDRLIGPGMLLNEMPCDAQGNILLKSYWMQFQKDTSWPVPNRLVCFFLCSSEPTHRVDTQTGTIIDDNSDNNYIKRITLSVSFGPEKKL